MESSAVNLPGCAVDRVRRAIRMAKGFKRRGYPTPLLGGTGALSHATPPPLLFCERTAASPARHCAIGLSRATTCLRRLAPQRPRPLSASRRRSSLDRTAPAPGQRRLGPRGTDSLGEPMCSGAWPCGQKTRTGSCLRTRQSRAHAGALHPGAPTADRPGETCTNRWPRAAQWPRHVPSSYVRRASAQPSPIRVSRALSSIGRTRHAGPAWHQPDRCRT